MLPFTLQQLRILKAIATEENFTKAVRLRVVGGRSWPQYRRRDGGRRAISETHSALLHLSGPMAARSGRGAPPLPRGTGGRGDGVQGPCGRPPPPPATRPARKQRRPRERENQQACASHTGMQ